MKRKILRDDAEPNFQRAACMIIHCRFTCCSDAIGQECARRDFMYLLES